MQDFNGTKRAVESDLEAILEIILESESIEDLCKRFVFGGWSDALLKGAFIYILNREAALQYAGGFGSSQREVDLKLAQISHLELWHALQRGTFITHPAGDPDGPTVFIPLMTGSIAIGLIAIVMSVDTTISPELERLFSRVSRSMGFGVSIFTKHPPRLRIHSESSTSIASSLTDRQFQVLRLLDQGRTNNEIAQELMVSESTVRHETMKIYAFFKVGSRSEAALAARQHGLFK